MDVLRVRDHKLNTKLERDQCIDARTKYLARIASEIRPFSSAAASIYLREANMIRHTEYGASGSMFPRNTICERCGTFWTSEEVSVRTVRRKRVSKGRIARLQRKQNIRPWMLTRFQKQELKQHERYMGSPTRLEFTCRICSHVMHSDMIPRNSSGEPPTKPQMVQETGTSDAPAADGNPKRKRKKNLLQMVRAVEPEPKSGSTLRSFLSNL